MPLNLRPAATKLNLKPVNTGLQLRFAKDKPSLNLKPVNLDIRPFKITGEEDPWTKMSRFQKTLDILGRPGYAVKSVMAQAQRENQTVIDEYSREINKRQEDFSPEERVEVMFRQGRKRLQIKERLKSAWSGLSGQERVTANELWGNVGVKGVPLLGFATEIVTDPMMYGGYSGITKGVGKTLKVTGKIAKKIPGVEKAVTKVGTKVQPVAAHLKEMFVAKTGIKKLNTMIEKHLGQRQYLKGEELKYGIKTRNAIQNISKKYGQSIDDVEKQVVALIEQPGRAIPNIVPETRALADDLTIHLSNILTTEMKAGVPITGLSKGTRGLSYFPRITTKEATQYLKQAKVGNAKIWDTKLANALKRKTGDFTLEEFNAFVSAHGLKVLGGRSVEQFFMKHPAYAVATRGLRSAKAVTSAQFLDDVGRTFGTKAKKAPAHWQKLPENVTRLNPSLKGLKFDPEVAGEVLRTTKSYVNPESARGFVKMFDTVQNTWKRWTLAPFPKYHLRNMVGNTWNIYLEGSTRPRHFVKMQALQTYRKYKDAPRMGNFARAELAKIGVTPAQADDLIMQMEKTGVLGRGWYAADIETGIEKELTKGFLGKPLRTKLKKTVTGQIAIEKGMALGSTIENNARGALWLARLDKGDDALTAAGTMKKFLFDYGDLTAFEKQIMKRTMPFYTWTRKNVPLQAEFLWKQPQKFAPIAIPLRARNAQDLLRLKYARPDLYERLPIEYRRNADTVTYIPLEGLVPVGDLAKMVRPQEVFVELLTPYLRAPIEMRMNKSFYFETEIQRYSKETQPLLRMDIPVRMKYLLTTVIPQARMLNELNKLVKKQVRKEELTPDEQIFAQSLSSVYKVNLEDLKDRASREVERKINELKKGAFWAKRYERTEEGRRIRETYKEFKTLMEQIRQKQ